MSKSEIEAIAEEIWQDPRIDRRLHKTCLALRAACMNHTLAGNPKYEHKFLKQADAFAQSGRMDAQQKTHVSENDFNR
jgi:hypothetical protein